MFFFKSFIHPLNVANKLYICVNHFLCSYLVGRITQTSKPYIANWTIYWAKEMVLYVQMDLRSKMKHDWLLNLPLFIENLSQILATLRPKATNFSNRLVRLMNQPTFLQDIGLSKSKACRQRHTYIAQKSHWNTTDKLRLHKKPGMV